nr:immunoglobulin heavy chain junction region [Macaca mulatta]MOX05267.1 immunoglobulin heavy chain junction region [Macaca mulatta]
CPQGSNFDYW